MKIEPYSTELKPLWDQHVSAARNGHFMHLRDYMDYHSDRFIDYSWILEPTVGRLFL